MLTEDSDNREESSVGILNIRNSDGNNFVGDINPEGNIISLPRSDSFTHQTELSPTEKTEKLCVISTETSNIAVIEGYEFLPEHLFQFQGIPPPLICSSWLKLLNSDEESGEDSIPLSRLRKIIKKKKKKLNKSSTSTSFINSKELNSLSQKPEKKRKKQKQQNEYSPIKRRRGRPKKKQQTENTGISTETDFENDWIEPLWNCESDASNHDTQDTVEVDNNFENQNQNASSVVNYNEHDYFKPVENTLLESSEVGDKTEKKGKKKSAELGVKIGVSKISFPCLECGKSFSAASTLKCHQRIHNGTLLICPECHKGFVSKYLLKCHMRIHNGDLFMCHKCGRGFTTAELLKVHSRAHTGDRPFVCNICGKSFPTSSNMLQHKQIHNSEKKFLCSQCGSSFVQKRCLDYHMLTHAEKKNICNVCGKLWARKSDLIEHMRVHTGVKPYCCSVCPQKFSQASSLKRHQLVHMDIKPIHCETCNKMFKCQEYYKRHLRKHKKEDYLYSDI